MGKLRELKITLLVKLAPKLEPFGFKLRKNESMFYRKRLFGEDRFWVSSINHADDFDVEGGVGIRIDGIEDIVTEFRSGLNPFFKLREWEKKRKPGATIGAELGNLVSRWPHRWTISSEADLEYVRNGIASMFEKVGLPFFERFNTLEAIIDLLAKNDNESGLFCPFILIRSEKALAGAFCKKDKVLFESIFVAKNRMHQERIKRFPDEKDDYQEFLNFADRLRGKWISNKLTMSKLTYENFIPVLLKAVSEVKTIYEEHLKMYDEVLPHVFMGDVTRFIVGLCKKSQIIGKDSKQSSIILVKALRILEDAMVSSDPKLQELVSVSFLENLDYKSKVYGELKRLLGPYLKKELEIYEKQHTA